MAVTNTTIKVPSDLRDRINAAARERGVSAASYIDYLMERDEHRKRMKAFGEAFKTADAEYYEEMRIWDATLMDGMDGY